MIQKKVNQIVCAIAALAIAGNASAGDKPLKVYIMAGQSNMQGQAQVETIERLKLAGGNMEMYRDMMGDDDKLDAPKGVYGVYFTSGDMSKGEARPIEECSGALMPGFTPSPGPKQRYGPEYTFGIYMRKHLNEPIMIIKTAWGGRGLYQQFRSPSAGDYKEAKDGHGNPTGAYYHYMIKHVQSALANLGKYHPDYDPKAGYEIAGFVWLQGFNDLIGPYPENDFSEYTRLLACLIRDLRKDLKVPAMPFLIGVMGIGGPDDKVDEKQRSFRKSQIAVAAMAEFKDNVVAVQTGGLWDMELDRIQDKLSAAIEKKIKSENPKIKDRSLQTQVKKERKNMAPSILTADELKILDVGLSNQAFHYLGSALIYGNIGKAFADAMHPFSKKN